MKIINEKGKLFGIINVVDFLVVLFILLVVGGVAWKIFGSSISDAASTVISSRNETEITYTVRMSGVRESLIDQVTDIGLPQQLAINEGLVKGCYLTDITVEPSTVLSYDRDYAEMVEYGGRVDAIATIKAKIPKGELVAVGSQEVRIGKTHIVKTQFFEMSGVIETLELNRADFPSVPMTAN